jgi:hypothetical protein
VVSKLSKCAACSSAQHFVVLEGQGLGTYSLISSSSPSARKGALRHWEEMRGFIGLFDCRSRRLLASRLVAPRKGKKRQNWRQKAYIYLGRPCMRQDANRRSPGGPAAAGGGDDELPRTFVLTMVPNLELCRLGEFLAWLVPCNLSC